MQAVRKLGFHLLVAIPLSLASLAAADEGMWLFNDLPVDYLQENYDFTPTDEWADHVMRSSVRFNSGGSASFVSSNGLVLTNHHVGADTLHKLSSPEHNYIDDGFLAKSLDEEIPAPDLELNQLVSIEDVTDRVLGAIADDMSPADAMAARRAAMAEIEKESLDETGLRSDVVTLFGGARYHLYRYKKYTDVRLVWAPEQAAAFFGGDADNFEYPRYDLDVCIFRVYEDGKPAEIEHFLGMSRNGAADGELVFVSGNPGRTQRLLTFDALKYQRDFELPLVMDRLRRSEILLQQYGQESDEATRRGRDDLFGVQNSRKALGGRLEGLQTPSFMEAKDASEWALRKRVMDDPKLTEYGDVWPIIANAQGRKKSLLDKRARFGGKLYGKANTLVLMATEDEKPSAERLREYRDSNRESLMQGLLSPAPIYADLERAELADSIALFMEMRGGDDPLVQKVLDGKSPRERAAAMVNGTKLFDVDERKRLAEGGLAAIEASTDPMIVMARLMAPEYRAVRETWEEIDEVERQAYGRLADVLFAVEGDDTYPDATFTLRLAFGPVKGYIEDGRQVPPWTTIGGAFEHEKAHGAKDPWKLPESFHAAKDKLDLDTPCNFVCTADIIGGNSGSPVINREGELVGVIFDGNIQSLTANYFYSDEVSRAVSVDSRFLLEALRKIYGAGALADQLGK